MSCLIGGGSCDFQPSFMGGSVRFALIGRGGSCVFSNKSSNISKTTATNQCKRVPDLRRPGSVRIKRYCAKTVD